jgi:hypothetical protein
MAGGTLRFNPQTGGVAWAAPTIVPVVERVTLTQSHLQAKGFFLKNAPLYPDTVMLIPDGGIIQVKGVDFDLQGRFLSWNELGLDNFLEENEVLTILYST